MAVKVELREGILGLNRTFRGAVVGTFGWIVLLLIAGWVVYVLSRKPSGTSAVTMTVRESLTTEDAERQHEREKELRQEWREELRHYLGAKRAKELEPCYRELFGGDIECLFNFRMYMARADQGPATLLVPPDDYYRHRFDVLAMTGAVQHGEAVSMGERLGCLTMDQMRKMADAMGVKRAQSKRELRERIEAMGVDAIATAWPATGLPVTDIFLLDPARLRERCG